MLQRKRLACSFCGKSESEVAKLVARPKVYICNECVAVASRIMQEDSTDQQSAQGTQPSILERLWSRIRRALHWGPTQHSAYQLACPYAVRESRSSLCPDGAPCSLVSYKARPPQFVSDRSRCASGRFDNCRCAFTIPEMDYDDRILNRFD